MKKGNLHIKLIERSVTSSSRGNENPNRGHLGYKNKDLLVLNAIFLSEVLGNKSDLVLLN